MPGSKECVALVTAAIMGLFASTVPASSERGLDVGDAVNTDGSLSQAFLDEVERQDEA